MNKVRKFIEFLKETNVKVAIDWLLRKLWLQVIVALKTSHPARLLFGGYVFISLVGALLLMLPFTRTSGLSFIDAFFTSVSALCVTGLIVKDTANFFTFWGQLIILVLIFIGGLGYMTLGYFFLSQLRSKLTVKKMVLETFPGVQVGNLGQFVVRILKVAVFLQVLGFLLLAVDFINIHGKPVSEGLWHAAFNSISAYCNAGFSTFANSLEDFKADFIVNGVIIALIVIGGIGFVVIEEIIDHWTHRHKLPRRKISLHTRVALLASGLLILVGAVMIYFFENTHLFASFSLKEKVLASIFQSVTPRTAGFNTVSIKELTPGTHLLLLVLMFIGGSPTGTAGGVKTTTTAALFFWLLAYSKGRETVSFGGYRLPDETLKRAVAIFFWGMVYVVLATMAIFATERASASNFIPYLFEVVSAFGTVGLSFGSVAHKNVSLAADFTNAGKFIIIITMLVGKVGILAALSSFVRRERQYFRYPEGKYIVG